MVNVCACVFYVNVEKLGGKRKFFVQNMFQGSCGPSIGSSFVMFRRDEDFVGSGALKLCPEIPLVNNNNRK